MSLPYINPYMYEPGAGSDQWPANARRRDREIRIEIFEPEANPRTFVTDFGTLNIRVRVQAVWEHRDNPNQQISLPGFQGVTGVLMGIARPGQQRFTGTGWAVTPFPVFFDPLDFGQLSLVGGVSGGIALEFDLSFRGSDLMPGPATLEVRAEGHGRHGRVDNPRATEVASRPFTVDGTPPETQGRVWDLTHPLVTGTVTDTGAGPGRVKLEVRDTTTGKMWDEQSKQWKTSYQSFHIDTDEDGNWFWHFLESDDIGGGGRYRITARGEDAATGTRGGWGNIDTTPLELISLVSDRPPQLTVDSPQPEQEVGASATFTGRADDDRAISHVSIALRDAYLGDYYNFDSHTFGAPNDERAELEVLSVSEVSRRWDYRWTWQFEEPPDGSGRYELEVVARDVTGDLSALAMVPFRGANDRIPPTVQISGPSGVLTGNPFGSGSHIRGTAADDDSGIAEIILIVEDLDTGLFWHWQSGRWESDRQEWSAEIVLQPGQNDVTWSSYYFDPDVYGDPGTGAYRVYARAVDSSGTESPNVSVDFKIKHAR